MSFQLPARIGDYVLVEARCPDVYVARATGGPSGHGGVVSFEWADVIDAPGIEAFKMRATAARALDRPGLARIVDGGGLKIGVFAVYSHGEGARLPRVLDDLHSGATRLDPIFVARALIPLLASLSALHRLDDRDGRPLGRFLGRLSPASLLLGEDGQLVLCELGLASGGAQLQQERLMPGYAAPEQVLGAAVDARADLFAFGALAFELFTGRACFPGSSARERLQAVIDPNFVAPSAIRPELPAGLDPILKTALAPDPGDRFQDAAQLSDALQAIVRAAGPQITAPNVARHLADAAEERTRVMRAPTVLQDFYSEGQPLLDWSIPEVATQAIEPTLIRTPSPPERAERPSAPRPQHAAPAPPQRSALRLPLFLAALVLFASTLATSVLLYEEPVPTVATSPPPLADPVPGAVPLPAPVPGPVPELIPGPGPGPGPDSDPKPGPGPGPDQNHRKPRTPIAQPKPAPPPSTAPPPSPAPADPQAKRISALVDRARAASASSDDPDRRRQLDRIMSRLVLEASSDAPGRSARIDALERELAAL